MPACSCESLGEVCVRTSHQSGKLATTSNGVRVTCVQAANSATEISRKNKAKMGSDLNREFVRDTDEERNSARNKCTNETKQEESSRKHIKVYCRN